MHVCLVTPFAWSQPHEVNDHVGGIAAELRRLGHTVDQGVQPRFSRDEGCAGRRPEELRDQVSGDGGADLTARLPPTQIFDENWDGTPPPGVLLSTQSGDSSS